MNLPPQPRPHESGGVPVISDTSAIFDGSLSLEVMSKIWYFEIGAGFALGQRLGVPNQVVATRRVELVVVDHRHAARIPVRLVRDVPHEPRLGWIGDLENRRAVPLHLSRDRVEQRLHLGEALMVPHVYPVAVRGVGLRRHDERRASLQVVVPDQAYVLCSFGERIGSGGGRWIIYGRRGLASGRTANTAATTSTARPSPPVGST